MQKLQKTTSNISILTWERWINPESCTPNKEITLANLKELEAQGPCTGHRSIIAILFCFSFKYMKREKGRDLTQYTNLCGLNTLPHLHD